MRNVLFIVSGPSGVGKGTVVKSAVARNENLALSVSCTTRPPRAEEKEGVDYFFLSREEFLRRKEEGEFLECDEHFGHIYGTPKPFVLKRLKEKSVLLEIDVDGALYARKVLEKDVPVVLIMIVPPDLKTLEERLEGRKTESSEKRKERADRVEYELSLQNRYDYVIVNDELERTVQQLLSIVEKEITV